MRSFFHNRLVIALIVVTAVVLVLTIIGAYTGGQASPVSNIVSVVTAPVERLFSWCAGGIRDGLAYISDFDALKLENEQLRKELLEKEELIRKAEQYKEENVKLRELLNISQENEAYTLEMCDIIARSDGDYTASFTIDKGSHSGIEVGDTVIVSEGYVGYVCEVGTNWSQVQTCIDSGISVGVQNIRTKETMICQGNFDLMKEGRLQVAYTGLDTSLYVGDELCTSGLSENVPHGIMVGEVSQISVSDDGTGKVASVVPFVELDSLDMVFVITDFVKEG